MKALRIITFVLTIITSILLIVCLLYMKNGYQIYFSIGKLKIGNSNNNIIYIAIGLIFFYFALYFLIKQLIRKKGIMLSIILFFMIFMLPFMFLITKGMNRNHSFLYTTSANKKLLLMGYGDNKKDIKMKYVVYEKLVLGFYEKIGEIEYVDYVIKSDDININDGDIIDNKLFYTDDGKIITFTFIDSDNNTKNIEMKYKH